MPWLLASPVYQQTWYWLLITCIMSVRMNERNLYIFLLNNLACKELSKRMVKLTAACWLVIIGSGNITCTKPLSQSKLPCHDRTTTERESERSQNVLSTKELVFFFFFFSFWSVNADINPHCDPSVWQVLTASGPPSQYKDRFFKVWGFPC